MPSLQYVSGLILGCTARRKDYWAPDYQAKGSHAPPPLNAHRLSFLNPTLLTFMVKITIINPGQNLI